MTDFKRRKVLNCMAWAGTGVVWTLVGGVPKSRLLGGAQAAQSDLGGFSFVQLSDTHIGFNKDANPDVIGSAKQAIAKINAMPDKPAFVLHTGDVTHLSKPSEFDAAQQLLSDIWARPIHFIPGEHDVLDENPGALFKERFGKATQGDGWYSFDQGGAHFIGLINVLGFGASGQGQLGAAQLEWVAKDLKGLSASTPIILFTHIPLWTLYAPWGWGTADAEPLFAALRRFGSVTVLNGHIHQIVQKVEGNIVFHSALSTAYPQPKPGAAPSPGPLKVPADTLGTMLGVREVSILPGRQELALVDTTLQGGV